MASLQKSSHVEDDGLRRLNVKASAETEYISKYRSGEVEQKKTVFEHSVIPMNPPAYEQSPHFSWSTRYTL